MKKHLLVGFALAIATTLFAISYALGKQTPQTIWLNFQGIMNLSNFLQ